jgi:hypothetical protein
MAGGLIQLVAYGAQDMFLTKDPQITFFKMVYRRHTNFSTEVIPQYFIQTPNFGNRVSCVLSKNGDLISKIHLVAILPNIPEFKDINGNPDILSKFAWVRRIGYALIKTVEIEIGNELIDRQYGDWLNIWHELYLPNNMDIDKIIGDVQELYDFTNSKKSYKLIIPLRFWFNRIYGLALPVVSLQYNHITINLELNDTNKCYNVIPTDYIAVDNDLVNFIDYEYIEQIIEGVSSLARYIHFDVINRYMYIWRISNNSFKSVTVSDNTKIMTEQQQREILYKRDKSGNFVNQQYFIIGLESKFEAMPRINSSERVVINSSVNLKNISLNDSYLLVEYIFLDDTERMRFAQSKHEYLIQQLAYNGENTLNGINQSFKIGFTKPCIELYWVTQLNQAIKINSTFNYSDSLIDNNKTGNILVKQSILFNGQERVTTRDSYYFTDLQIYEHHTNSHNVINTYSFALYPEKNQISGAVNMSKIDNILLKVSSNPNINFNNTAKIRIYGLTENILRIVHGISGLVFANDSSYLINYI